MCEPESINMAEMGLTYDVVLNRLRNTAMWIMKPGECIGCSAIWAGAILETCEYLEGRLSGGMNQNITDGTYYHFYGPIQDLTINENQEHP